MFNPETKSKILTIFAIPLTQDNATQLGDRLDAIELIDDGSMVYPIEDLIDSIESIESIISSPTGLQSAGMIKADVVEWRQGASLGTVDRYNQLKNRLGELLGLARSGGQPSMVRTDRYSLTGWGSTYTDWRFIAW
jgi:hypothetical protein